MLAILWGFSNGTNILGAEYTENQGKQWKAIQGQLSIAVAQDSVRRSYSSVRATRAEQFQEKPQYIIKLQNALQLTSRRNPKE